MRHNLITRSSPIKISAGADILVPVRKNQKGQPSHPQSVPANAPHRYRGSTDRNNQLAKLQRQSALASFATTVVFAEVLCHANSQEPKI